MDQIKDHVIAKAINDLRDIAIKYHNTQQLREQIASIVRPLLQQSPAVAVPDGWKLVPIVLTDEMVEAFNIAEDSFQDGRGTAPDCHWAAMISAAPINDSNPSPRITEQELPEPSERDVYRWFQESTIAHHIEEGGGHISKRAMFLAKKAIEFALHN